MDKNFLSSPVTNHKLGIFNANCLLRKYWTMQFQKSNGIGLFDIHTLHSASFGSPFVYQLLDLLFTDFSLNLWILQAKCG